ncbi:MAG: hypothetical protein U1F57_02670 [bacterium]
MRIFGHVRPAPAPQTIPGNPNPMGQAPLPPRQGVGTVDRKVVNLTGDIPIQIVAVLRQKRSPKRRGFAQMEK